MIEFKKLVRRTSPKKIKRSKRHFKRIGIQYFDKKNKDNPKTTVTCVDSDSFKSYDELKQHVISLKLKNLPVCIVGDAKYPPMPFPIFRYYLIYNPENFIGEENMNMFDDNAFLVFNLNYPEDYGKIKHVAHRTVYLGSVVHIMLMCHSEAVLPQRTIRNECIDDYDIILQKNSLNYIPFHKELKTFIYNIPKNI